MTTVTVTHPTLLKEGVNPNLVRNHLNQVGLPALARLGFPAQTGPIKGEESVWGTSTYGQVFTLGLPRMTYNLPPPYGYDHAPGIIFAEFRLMRWEANPPHTPEPVLGLGMYVDRLPDYDMCIDYKSRGRFVNLLATLETDPVKWRAAGLELLSAVHHWLKDDWGREEVYGEEDDWEYEEEEA